MNSKASKSWTFLIWTLKPGVVLWSSWDSQFSVMEWGPGAEPQSPGLMATNLGSEDLQRICCWGERTSNAELIFFCEKMWHSRVLMNHTWR